MPRRTLPFADDLEIERIRNRRTRTTFGGTTHRSTAAKMARRYIASSVLTQEGAGSAEVLTVDAPLSLIRWEDMRQAYCRGTSYQEIAEASGLTLKAVRSRGLAEGWVKERSDLRVETHRRLMEKYGTNADAQAQVLLGLHGRVVEVTEAELAAWESSGGPETVEERARAKDRADTLKALQNILTQATQSLRLLLGAPTERVDMHTRIEALILQATTPMGLLGPLQGDPPAPVGMTAERAVTSEEPP